MAAFFALSFFVFCFLSGASNAYKLSPENFYAETCPDALTKIQEVVYRTVSKDSRMGASLLRLHFHDCFVNGCDASVLLNHTLTMSEQQAPPNKGSLRGFEVIDTIKSEVESWCDRVVSCADILAVAARDSVVALGGPTWEVQLGRKDSLIANFLGALTDLPGPTSDLSSLILAFKKKNLNSVDMVALSGGHTIGQAKCKNFRTRIYSESNIDSTYARTLKKTCSENSGASDDNLSPLDKTANLFDNTYFRDLVEKRGLLQSDQELFSTQGSIKSLVYWYSINATSFYADFTSAMVKMGKLSSPPTGPIGEIRKYCWKTNAGL